MKKTKSTRPGGSQMKRKGEAGAARNYITRNQALKKLQVTLSDFRRLCILKGIYPREPRNKKKANRGSTAPTTFYYIKDVAYLQHEPVLHKLREHKAFAKKLSRALGRGQEGLAKNLEARHEGYRLDHIIKERYPTFVDSIRDLDDALSLIVLFAHLPASPRISSTVIANCARLAAEWQLYVIRSRSLTKVFLSIKGIYFQAEVAGQKVTWLVPYAFTQRVPSDVDFRIMLTFLELYQTLLGFVFFKLFTDVNLVYPPQIDAAKDEAGAGVGALVLEETNRTLTAAAATTTEGADEAATRKKTTAKEVRRQIKEITVGAGVSDETVEQDQVNPIAPVASTSTQLDAFPTAAGTDSLVAPSQDEANHTSLFEPYRFFLSREVTRPTLEFVVRSFGGQVGWDPVLGAGSPFTEDDPKITHHVVDRPVPEGYYDARHPEVRRAYIQPQWVVDCVNRKRLLPTEEYGPGKTLPPHLSPFVDEEETRQQGGYVPEAAREVVAPAAEPLDPEDEDEEDVMEEDPDEEEDIDDGPGPALLAAAQRPDDAALLHAAELEAEARGIPHAQFQVRLAAEQKLAAKKKPVQKGSSTTKEGEKELAEIMLTGKQRKLYNKMSYTKERKAEERAKLEAKKKALSKKGR